MQPRHSPNRQFFHPGDIATPHAQLIEFYHPGKPTRVSSSSLSVSQELKRQRRNDFQYQAPGGAPCHGNISRNKNPNLQNAKTKINTGIKEANRASTVHQKKIPHLVKIEPLHQVTSLNNDAPSSFNPTHPAHGSPIRYQQDQFIQRKPNIEQKRLINSPIRSTMGNASLPPRLGRIAQMSSVQFSLPNNSLDPSSTRPICLSQQNLQHLRMQENPQLHIPTFHLPIPYVPMSHAPMPDVTTSLTPASQAPTAHARAHNARKSHVPTSHASTFHVPTIHVPTSDVPASYVPTPHAPVSDAPTSEAPTSDVPTSDVPTSHVPTSHVPTSHVLTSHVLTSHSQVSHAPTFHPRASHVPMPQLPIADVTISDVSASDVPTCHVPMPGVANHESVFSTRQVASGLQQSSAIPMPKFVRRKSLSSKRQSVGTSAPFSQLDNARVHRHTMISTLAERTKEWVGHFTPFEWLSRIRDRSAPPPSVRNETIEKCEGKSFIPSSSGVNQSDNTPREKFLFSVNSGSAPAISSTPSSHSPSFSVQCEKESPYDQPLPPRKTMATMEDSHRSTQSTFGVPVLIQQAGRTSLRQQPMVLPSESRILVQSHCKPPRFGQPEYPHPTVDTRHAAPFFNGFPDRTHASRMSPIKSESQSSLNVLSIKQRFLLPDRLYEPCPAALIRRASHPQHCLRLQREPMQMSKVNPIKVANISCHLGLPGQASTNPIFKVKILKTLGPTLPLVSPILNITHSQRTVEKPKETHIESLPFTALPNSNIIVKSISPEKPDETAKSYSSVEQLRALIQSLQQQTSDEVSMEIESMRSKLKQISSLIDSLETNTNKMIITSQKLKKQSLTATPTSISTERKISSHAALQNIGLKDIVRLDDTSSDTLGLVPSIAADRLSESPSPKSKPQKKTIEVTGIQTASISLIPGVQQPMLSCDALRLCSHTLGAKNCYSSGDMDNVLTVASNYDPPAIKQTNPFEPTSPVTFPSSLTSLNKVCPVVDRTRDVYAETVQSNTNQTGEIGDYIEVSSSSTLEINIETSSTSGRNLQDTVKKIDENRNEEWTDSESDTNINKMPKVLGFQYSPLRSLSRFQRRMSDIFVTTDELKTCRAEEETEWETESSDLDLSPSKEKKRYKNEALQNYSKNPKTENEKQRLVSDTDVFNIEMETKSNLSPKLMKRKTDIQEPKTHLEDDWTFVPNHHQQETSEHQEEVKTRAATSDEKVRQRNNENREEQIGLWKSSVRALGIAYSEKSTSLDTLDYLVEPSLNESSLSAMESEECLSEPSNTSFPCQTLNPVCAQFGHIEAFLKITNHTELDIDDLYFCLRNYNKGERKVAGRLYKAWLPELEIIEQGSFGTVYGGYYKNKKVAIKMPSEAALTWSIELTLERYLHEWHMLDKCRHPGIINLLGGVVVSEKLVWIVTERIAGADLHTVRHRQNRIIDYLSSIKMCYQLSCILQYLHTVDLFNNKKVVVHRDIKPENLLIDPNFTVHLCDFGDSEESEHGQISSVKGATWLYAPVELLRSKLLCSQDEQHYSGNHIAEPVDLNLKWDVWSVGCVFQEMLGGPHPFKEYVYNSPDPDETVKILRELALSKKLIPRIPDNFPLIFKKIITECLNPDPSGRPTADELVAVWHEIINNFATKRKFPEDR